MQTIASLSGRVANLYALNGRSGAELQRQQSSLTISNSVYDIPPGRNEASPSVC